MKTFPVENSPNYSTRGGRRKDKIDSRYNKVKPSSLNRASTIHPIQLSRRITIRGSTKILEKCSWRASIRRGGGMKRESDDLSPDLEWMLQSEQVESEILAEHLVREYYLTIYAQCQTCLVYPDVARRAALETFLTAVESASEYPGGDRIAEWLSSLAELSCQVHAGHLQQQSFLNRQLIRSILNRSPAALADPGAVDRAILEVKSRLQARQRKRRARTTALEVGFAALAVILVLVALESAITLPAAPLQDPGRAAETAGAAGDAAVVPTLQATTPATGDLEQGVPLWKGGIPLQPPLSRNSTHEEIWRRLLLSRFAWDTLWADVWLVLRGPEDYNGPTLVERHQLWVDQGAMAFHIGGSPSRDPTYSKRMDQQHPAPGPARFLTSLDDYARVGSQLPWFFLSNELVFNSPFLIRFYFTGILDFPPSRLFFLAVGEDELLNLETVVVDAIDLDGNRTARLWLESRTGIVLRAQYFIPGSSQEAPLEVKVSRLSLNVPFPDALYLEEPGSKGETTFAQDHTARPEPDNLKPLFRPIWELDPDIRLVPYPPPKEGSEMSVFPNMVFQPLEVGPVVYTEDTVVQIFADQYLLTEMIAGDLIGLVCDRSPENNLIAFSPSPITADGARGVIRWIDFKSGVEGESTLPGITITRLAISPDHRYLAVAGFDREDGRGRLHLVDMKTGELRALSEGELAWALAWSPDGTQLASLKWSGAGLGSANPILVRVYDTTTGKPIHAPAEGVSWGSTSLTVLLPGWTAVFPLPTLVVEDCISPPRASNP